MRTERKGFTLVELLVVIAIIGLLSTLAVVALNSARQKSRDAKRVADIKQIQTALELYYGDNNGYPTTPSGAGNNVLGTVVKSLCTGPTGTAGNGWATATTCASAITYMTGVPAAPTPQDGTCTAAENSYTYTGGGTCGTTCPQYSITFCLGAATGNLAAGVRTASESGIR